MEIVWDTQKAATNFRKHRVEFSHAATVLDDPGALTIEDNRHDEPVCHPLGSDLMGRILIVVYAYGVDDTIRLISARKASVRERSVYEQQ